MWLKVTFLTALVAVVYLDGGVNGQDFCNTDGCRLGREASYFITSPKVIRPDHIVQMTVTMLKMYYPRVTVRCAIRRHDEDMATAERTFTTEGHAVVQLKIPANAQPGNYTLRVEGTEDSGFGGSLFVNETEIFYDSKQLSVLIQPIRPFFCQGQPVHFRVMPVENNLMSRSGSMDVYIIDATQNIVKRWLSMQTNAGGVLELEYPLSDQPKFGMWQIKVNAFGHEYVKDFEVIEFWATYIDVNVSMPLYHIADDYGIAGTVMANMSISQVARGNITYTAEIRLPPGSRDPNKEYTWPTIKRETRYFPGTSDFMFTMEELKKANGGKIAEHEVYVEAYVFDWFTVQGASGSALTAIYPNAVKLVLLGDASRTFKPNQVFDVYFAVRHMDGTPLNRPRRVVTVRLNPSSSASPSVEERLLADDKGIVHFRHSPTYRDTSFSLVAWYDAMESDQVDVMFYRHYSYSDSYIYLTTSTTQPEVDKYMVFTVTTNTFTDKIYFLMTSSGNIVTSGILDMTSTQKTFSVALSRDMIPECHMVVWHIQKGEVIADSLNFFVNGTRLNPVEIRFNRGKDFTGNTVELTGITDPSSFIGAQVMDYELWSRGWSSLYTEADIIRELDTFEAHVNKSFEYTWKLAEEQEQLIHFPAPNYGVDANTTFEYAGLLVLTDANVTRIYHDCNETMGYLPCMSGSCYLKTQRCDGTRQCLDGQDEMGCVYPVKEIYTPPKRRLSLLTRHFYRMGRWVWGSHFVMPNGRLDAIVSIPDDPMTWVMGGFAISKDKGFGVIYDPPRHEGTRPFFIRTEAPGRIRKGEQVGIHIGLFNYWDQDVEALVMLHDSDDYRFIVVEEFGFVLSYDPRTIRGDIQTMVFVPKGQVRQVHMPVVPVKDGCVDVKISVLTFIWSDSHTLTMCSTYDGVTNHLHTPYFLDLVSSGSLQLPNLDIPVDEKFINPQTRKHIYVPGSPKATVGIVGDVVGPGFFKSFPTAEDTLRKPWASAEQNMYNFAYTLYNLLYQRETQQLTPERLRESLIHLNQALQRQLSYMNSDGSFQMFRDYQTYTPSIWVTSFTLRILYDANVKEWETEYFFIPSSLLNKIEDWLVRQQNTSGVFREHYAPAYDRKMEPVVEPMPGATTDPPTDVALTAYVLITLAESTSRTAAMDKAINRAKRYLEGVASVITDPYQMCITAYALEVSSSEKRIAAFQRMRGLSFRGQQIYWAKKEIPENEIKIVDTLPYHQPRRWYDNEAYAVEGTSYALLCYLRKNEASEANKIMRWLQTMRNHFAGMASTQDSYMALKALGKFAKRDTNRGLYHMEFNIRSVSNTNVTHIVNLNLSNWRTQQHLDIHPVYGSVRGGVKGTGFALMQLATDVNVEYKEQILPNSSAHFFDTDIEFTYGGWNSSIIHYQACARWDRPDLTATSSLTAMEVHIPTGYVITNDVLRGYAQSGEVPNMHHAEMYDNDDYERKVVFYFDHLNTTMTCVKFRVDRWFPVANMSLQHIFKVYNYYEPGMHNTTLYRAQTLFGHHICQVCGSYQCPYCPFYNMAPPAVSASLVFSLIVTSLGLIVAQRLAGFRWT